MQLGFGMNHSLRNLDRLWSLPLAKAEFQIHYAKVHARCSTGTTQTRVEYLFKGAPDRQMLINLLELVVQFVKRSIDASPKLICCEYVHTCFFFTPCRCLDP